MAELTVFYDGRCNLCRSSARRVRRFDRRGRIELVDLEDPGAAARFPFLDRQAAMKSMQAIDRGGRVFTGADAWARIGLALPGWNLLARVLLLPGLRWIARKVYASIARNRYRSNPAACQEGNCAVDPESRSSRF